MGVELEPFQRGVVEDYNQGLPVTQIAIRHFCSESTVRRKVQSADRVGVEVDVRPRGRPQVNRKEILGRFGQALGTGCQREVAAQWTAKMVSCSESTVWRALRGG